MSKQTSLQELISFIEFSMRPSHNEKESSSLKAFYLALNGVKNKAIELLEKEKQDIEQAYRDGKNDSEYPSLPGMDTIYYEQTFTKK